MTMFKKNLCECPISKAFPWTIKNLHKKLINFLNKLISVELVFIYYILKNLINFKGVLSCSLNHKLVFKLKNQNILAYCFALKRLLATHYLF